MINKQFDVKKQHRLIKAKEVIKEYPMLTNYSIDKAVKEKKLPYTRVGNANYYDVLDIESFLMSHKRNDEDGEKTN